MVHKTGLKWIYDISRRNQMFDPSDGVNSHDPVDQPTYLQVMGQERVETPKGSGDPS
jgi:hypothetical protein